MHFMQSQAIHKRFLWVTVDRNVWVEFGGVLQLITFWKVELRFSSCFAYCKFPVADTDFGEWVISLSWFALPSGKALVRKWQLRDLKGDCQKINWRGRSILVEESYRVEAPGKKVPGACKGWKEDRSEQGGETSWETGKVGGRDLIVCKTLQVRRRILVFSFYVSGRRIKAGIRETIWSGLCCVWLLCGHGWVSCQNTLQLSFLALS